MNYLDLIAQAQRSNDAKIVQQQWHTWAKQTATTATAMINFAMDNLIQTFPTVVGIATTPEQMVKLSVSLTFSYLKAVLEGCQQECESPEAISEYLEQYSKDKQ